MTGQFCNRKIRVVDECGRGTADNDNSWATGAVLMRAVTRSLRNLVNPIYGRAVKSANRCIQDGRADFVPGKGIEPSLLSKLDFESSAPSIRIANQCVTGGIGGFAKSLQIIAELLQRVAVRA